MRATHPLLALAPEARRATAPGNVTDSLNTQIQRIDASATELSAAIDAAAAGLDEAAASSSPPSSVQDIIVSLLTMIGGVASSIRDALAALSNALFGNASFVSSLTTQVASLLAGIDNGLSSLPGGASYATIGAVGSDGSGGISVTIVAGLGANNGNYQLDASTISNGISANSNFALSNGANQIVLVNRSGSMLNTAPRVMAYLRTMYPQSSRISTSLADAVYNGIRAQLGGNSSSVRARAAQIDASLLQSPTGVVAIDLLTARILLSAAPGATLESDIQGLISAVGGPSSDLESALLGDPGAGTPGLSGLVGAAAANNPANIWNDVSDLQNATSLADQVQAFLQLFSASNTANSSATQMTLDLSGGAPASLGELLNRVTSAS